MKEWLQRVMFDPPWWSILINPHFLSRRALYRAMSVAAVELQGRVLDVGCGIQPYRHLLVAAKEVTGLELDTPENRAHKRADTFYNGHVFPFPDAHFEGVLCNQVLEHVFNQEQFLAEIHRILAPKGILVLSVPFAWPEHEQPLDCLRYTSFGLLDRLNRADFDIIHHNKLVVGGAALCALAADQLHTWMRPVPLLARLVAHTILIAPMSLLGWALAGISSTNPELFLDNFVIARKLVTTR